MRWAGLVVMCSTMACARSAATPPARALVVHEREPPHFAPRSHHAGYSGPPHLDVHRDTAGQLRVSAVAPRLLGPASKKKLMAGLVVEITWRVHILKPRETQPRAFGSFGCRVAFDLSNSIFYIVMIDGTKRVVVNVEAVEQLCLSLNELPLKVNGYLTPAAQYRVLAVAEVDPKTPSFAMLKSPGAAATASVGVPSGAVAHHLVEGTFVP
jgi:hypothetical protein